MHKPGSALDTETNKILWDFEIQTNYLILDRGKDLEIINNNKKEPKRICRIEDFAVVVDHKVNIKEEKRDSYSDLAREVRKLCNMRVMVIPIVFAELATVPKDLEMVLEDMEIGGRIGNIQNTGLLRSVKITRRILVTWGDLKSLILQWKITKHARSNAAN